MSAPVSPAPAPVSVPAPVAPAPATAAPAPVAPAAPDDFQNPSALLKQGDRYSAAIEERIAFIKNFARLNKPLSAQFDAIVAEFFEKEFKEECKKNIDGLQHNSQGVTSILHEISVQMDRIYKEQNLDNAITNAKTITDTKDAIDRIFLAANNFLSPLVITNAKQLVEKAFTKALNVAQTKADANLVKLFADVGIVPREIGLFREYVVGKEDGIKKEEKAVREAMSKVPQILLQSLGYPRLSSTDTPGSSLGRNDFCIPEFRQATLTQKVTGGNLGEAEIKFSSQEEAEAFRRKLLGLRVDNEVNPLGTARVRPFKINAVIAQNDNSVKITGIPTEQADLENLLERIRDSDQAREFAKRDVERRLDQTTRSVTFISSAGIIPALQAGVGSLFAGLHRLLHPWCPGSAVVGSIASVACRSAARNFESVGHSLPQKSRDAFYRGAKGLNNIAESVEDREKYFAQNTANPSSAGYAFRSISTNVGAAVYSPMIAVGAATAGVAIAFNGVADPMLNVAKRVRESANQSARDGSKFSAFFKRVGAGILTGLAVPFRIVGAIAEKTTDLSLSIAGADRYQSGSLGFASKIGDAARKIRSTMHSLRISASSSIKADDKVEIADPYPRQGEQPAQQQGATKFRSLSRTSSVDLTPAPTAEKQLTNFDQLKKDAMYLARRIKNPKFENSSGIPGDNRKYLRVTTIDFGTGVDQKKYELLVAIDGTVKVVDSRRGASALRQEGEDVHPDCDIKEFCRRAKKPITEIVAADRNNKGMSIAQFEQYCRTPEDTFKFLENLKAFKTNDGRAEHEVGGYVVRFEGEVVCYKKGHPNQPLSTCAERGVSLEFFNFVAGLVEQEGKTLHEVPGTSPSHGLARSVADMAAARGSYTSI